MNNPAEDFKRLYITQNYRVILESARNSAGRFMKICKIQNETLNYLFIPKEINWQDWRNFCCCLDSFFITKYIQTKDSLGFSEKQHIQVGSKGAEMASKGEDWRKLEAKSVVQKKEEIKSHKQGWMGNEQ